jgi:flagellar basal body-associated protein FliL
VSGVSQQCNQEPEHTRDGLRWIIMGLLLLLLIPAVLGFVISFILNPVHVFTNIVQIIAAAATVLFGFVAYFQGFFESVATLYFGLSLLAWLGLVFLRRPGTVTT